MDITAAGAIILHFAQKVVARGLVASVQTGDRICVTARGWWPELLVFDEKFAQSNSALQLHTGPQKLIKVIIS